MSDMESVFDVTSEEISRLRRAVKESNLEPHDKNLILIMIDELVSIKKTHQEKMAALNRLRRVFEKKTEKRSVPAQKALEPSKGHGRRSVDEYQYANVVSHTHPSLRVGDTCPFCNHGKLQPRHPRRIIRLVGNAPIVAEMHSCEQFRCGGCGKIISTELPAEVETDKGTASANAVIAVFRYGLGIPHFRLATIQRAMGVPLSASTQYEMVEMLWTKVAPVFKVLLAHAANSPLLFADDTPARILEYICARDERKAEGKRVGIFTTAIIARHREYDIHLFFTGWQHAGENLSTLLSTRNEELPPPIQMTDAASRNLPKNHMAVVALCLIHSRRNFIDCENSFRDESTYVIERIGKVYQHERHVKKSGMNDQERLAYHQEHSAPVMEEIRAYATKKLEGREVEPNSILGQAFQYMLKHWDGLTKFLQVPGAPLDNNDAERLVKKSILHFKNSLFYKTEDGARVGDVLMSLIQTCMANGVNPFDYLTALEKHSQHVAKNPHLWLPWNYRNIIASIGPPSSAKQTSDNS